ncbi:hypothetical protein DOTSEDRAFT_83554 [Dothistroma septosporum NZE10]|uniref:Protein kinase domain-containing protein n=1 Tax=Dothistroma septosporum (strain NZE10 / CBS 128990) TaxID=675120 RepID=M2XHI2_DOTSN|nr:hypothetical protein DOTSEDRAFT_83554 [Dothistroma septosporum NZE10]
MSPAVPGAQLWVELEVEAWRAQRNGEGGDHGIGGVRTSARRRWDTMAEDRRSRLEAALRRWRASQARVATLLPVYEHEPNPDDMSAVKEYYEANEALATAMQSGNSSLEDLVTLHEALDDSGHISRDWLQRQDTCSEDLIDQIDERSLVWFKIRRAAEAEEQEDEYDEEASEEYALASGKLRRGLCHCTGNDSDWMIEITITKQPTTSTTRPRCRLFHWTTAGLLMERGRVEKVPDGLYQDWKEIVHGDLKLSTVFLGDNTSEVFRGYPQAKLGDIGSTVIADHGNV